MRLGRASVGALSFLGQIGARGDARTTLERLSHTLEQHDLRAADLLRLRIFTADLAAQADIERALEELLPRQSWPAITIVELPPGAESARNALSLDAIAAPEAHLARQPIGAVAHRRGDPHPRDEEPGRPEAVRYGPWVFVGAVVGASSRELTLPQRIEAQSESLFARMERLLHAADAQLGDIVKVGGWLSFPMGDYGPLGGVRSGLLARHGLLPASGAVQVGSGAGEGEPLLSFDAIAFAPAYAPRGGTGSSDGAGAARGSPAEHRELSPRPSDTVKPSPLASYYATARRADGYVFTCGEIPRIGGRAREQAEDVYEQLASHLGEYGATPSDVVHQTVFVRHLGDIPEIGAAASAFCGSRTPTTFVPVADMGFRPGVDVEIELIAEPRDGEREVGSRGDARRARDAR